MPRYKWTVEFDAANDADALAQVEAAKEQLRTSPTYSDELEEVDAHD